MDTAIEIKEEGQERVIEIVQRLAQIEYNQGVLDKQSRDEPQWVTNLNHTQKTANEEFEAMRLRIELQNLA